MFLQPRDWKVATSYEREHPVRDSGHLQPERADHVATESAANRTPSILPGTDLSRPFLPKAEIEQIQSGIVQHDRRDRQAARRCTRQFQLPASESRQQAIVDSRTTSICSTTAYRPSSCRPILPQAPSRTQKAFFTLTSQVDTAREPAAYVWGPTTTPRAADCAGHWPADATATAPKNQERRWDSGRPQHIKTPLMRPTLVGTYHFHTDDPGRYARGHRRGRGRNVHRKNNNYRVTDPPHRRASASTNSSGRPSMTASTSAASVRRS